MFIYYFNCVSFDIRLSGRKVAIKLIDWLCVCRCFSDVATAQSTSIVHGRNTVLVLEIRRANTGSVSWRILYSFVPDVSLTVCLSVCPDASPHFHTSCMHAHAFDAEPRNLTRWPLWKAENFRGRTPHPRGVKSYSLYALKAFDLGLAKLAWYPIKQLIDRHSIHRLTPRSAGS